MIFYEFDPKIPNILMSTVSPKKFFITSGSQIPVVFRLGPRIMTSRINLNPPDFLRVPPFIIESKDLILIVICNFNVVKMLFESSFHVLKVFRQH